MEEDSNLEKLITSRQEEGIKKSRAKLKKYGLLFLFGLILSLIFNQVSFFLLISFLVLIIISSIERMGN